MLESKRLCARKAAVFIAVAVIALLAVALYAQGFTLSGKITSYNPQNSAEIALYQNGEKITSVTIDSRSGNGEATQVFSIEGISAGVYDLTVTKSGCLTYTVKAISVSGDLDLASTELPGIADIRLVSGDISEDGFIDASDVSMLVFDLGKSKDNSTYSLSDINGDGYRDALDVAVLSANMLKTQNDITYPEDSGEEDISVTRILSFDSAGEGGWWGTTSPLWKTEGQNEGSGWLSGEAEGSASQVICGNLYGEVENAQTVPGNADYPIESADYADVSSDRYIVLDVYVSDVEAVTTMNVSFSSCRNGPVGDYTASWVVDTIDFENGWNTVSLTLEDASCGSEFDASKVQYISFTMNTMAACVWGVDDLRCTSDVAEDQPTDEPEDEPEDQPDDPPAQEPDDGNDQIADRVYTDTVYVNGAVEGVSLDEVEREYYLQVESTPMDAQPEIISVQSGAYDAGEYTEKVISLDGSWQMMKSDGSESYIYTEEMLPTSGYTKMNIVGFPIEASSQNTMMGDNYYAPSNVNDGAFNSEADDEWVSGGPSVDQEPWFIIDLLEERQINGFILYNNGALGVYDGSDRAENTRAFTVWISQDKEEWTSVYTTTRNTKSTTDVKLDGYYTARYVKVTLEQTEQAAKGYARIVEFELYGKEKIFTPAQLDFSTAYNVTVPRSVPNALYEAGVIGDPTVGYNDAQAREAVGNTWWFKKDFEYQISDGRVVLSFGGVCDRVDVWVNDVYQGFHQGMYGGPEYDITDIVRDGANSVVVRMYPVAGNWFDTVAFHAGWGWTYAKIPPLGIWQSVNVKTLSKVEIENPFVSAVDTNGTMDFYTEIVSPDKEAINGTLIASISPKNFEGESCSFTYPVSTQESETSLRLRFNIPSPQLWWPNGVGEQNLYILTLSFADEGGNIISEKKVQFGIRTIEMAPLEDVGEYSDVYNWTFIINGKKMFLHGANWCPIDAMMDFSYERYDRMLSLGKSQNLQILRAWGVGMVETEIFYDLCDEYGIFVYQEWPISWDSYKTQPEAVLYETVIYNTKRLRNRASLLMWGGGNESVAGMTEDILNEVGKLTIENDGTRPWHRTDPHGDASHLYDTYMGGMPLEENLTYESPFIGEFGVPSFPMRESISKYATEQELNTWPIVAGNSIDYHTLAFGNFSSLEMTGDVKTMTYYGQEFLKIDSLDDLILGSQLAQTVGITHTLQRARANFPSATAICYYKLTDVYPTASWAPVDYYGTPKIMHYFIQDVYQPLAAVAIFDKVSYYGENAEIPVYLLDDGDALADKQWTVNARVYNAAFDVVAGGSYSGSSSINSVNKLFDIKITSNITASAPLFFVTEVVIDGEVASRNYYFLNYNDGQGSLFTLPVTTVECRAEGDGFIVENTGDYPAVAVHFDCADVSDTFLPEDSYFWLDAGETRYIKVNSTQGVNGVKWWNMTDMADTAAPSAPSSLSAEALSESQIKLSWNAVVDARGYFVYQDGERIAYVRYEDTEYTVYGLGESEAHQYYVTAYDNGGNESAQSNTVSAQSKADAIAPSVVSVKMNDANSVTVVFSEAVDAASANDIANYAVSDGVAVASAALRDDGVTVDLTLSGAGESSEYSLTVSGVKDASANGNAMTAYTNFISYKLEAYWDFEKIEENRLYDVTGNAGLGTLLTDKVTREDNTAFGIGNGINFDGAVSSISIRKTALDMSQGFSISVMIKHDTITDSMQTILARNIYPISGHMNFVIYQGKPMFYSTDLTPRANFTADKVVSDGNWHHLGVTYDGSCVKMYVDGKLVNNYTGISGEIRRDDCEWAIGRLVRNINRFTGSIDEVRIYSRAITASEMEAIASALN